mgnify:CR=1 FL=1
MSGKANTCNDEAAVDCYEFKAALKLAYRKCFTHRDRLSDDGLDVQHESGFIDDTHEALETLFHAIVIPAIIGSPACAWEHPFVHASIHIMLGHRGVY